MRCSALLLSVAWCGPTFALLPSVAPQCGRAQRAQRAPQVLLASRHAALAGGLAAAGLVGAPPARAVQTEPLAYSTLLEELKNKKVSSAVISSDGKSVMTIAGDGTRRETAIFDATDLINRMRAAGVTFELAEPEVNIAGPLAELALGILPPLILLGGLFFILNRNGGMGGMGGMGPGGAMQFGKSKSEINMEPETGVTFEDVAGCDGSKLELTEVVDFLKNPAKYSALGAKVPRGCLMEGPPGTGKTLLAKAVAGEAGVPFISASGSEFVEMFVGVGASRVRDLFGQAKKNAPCIVFIDEIDAVGRARPGTGGGPSGGGGNDEREQTLNQILTEMDGFEGNSGVIVLAATNRADILDPALLRPGRFDRRVPVDLPDKSGREQILKVHARGKPLAPDVLLGEVAARTTGFSGASLQNLLNEAAIVAARRNLTAITYKEVDYAIDRITVGLQKTSSEGSAQTKRLVAYQQAGKAVMALLTPDYDAVSKITILPRAAGTAGGFTLLTPSDERMESGMYSKNYLLGQLAVLLGSRVAEELVYGAEDVTTGASADLQRVRDIAHRMVAQWGFTVSGVDLGLVGWEAPDAGRYSATTLSSDTEEAIDDEVQNIADYAYEACKGTLSRHRALMDLLVERLLAKETINAGEVLQILEEYDPQLYKELGKTPPPENEPLLTPAL